MFLGGHGMLLEDTLWIPVQSPRSTGVGICHSLNSYFELVYVSVIVLRTYSVYSTWKFWVVL